MKQHWKEYLTKQTAIRLTVAILFLLLYIGAIYFANRGWDGYTVTENIGTEYETARVLKILADNTTADDSIEGKRRGSMDLQVEVLSGRYEGDIVNVTNYLSAMYNVDVEEGDKVSVRIDTVGVNEYQVSIYNYERSTLMIALILIFALALVLIGGWQGLRAFIGLIFTFVSIIFLLIPLTLKGFPAVPLTLIIVSVTSVVCYYLLGGWQPRMIGAALGCLCGVVFAAIFGAAASNLACITAYQMDEAEALMLVMADTNLKMNGLFLSGILIASMGAVMDTSMSVASAMDELHLKRPDISVKELFCSGMKVGRDATGTMANTLVLAFAGSSLNMILLIYSYDVSFNQLMNTDFIAIELIRGIAGSMGIIMTVPCVAAITATLLKKIN